MRLVFNAKQATWETGGRRSGDIGDNPIPRPSFEMRQILSLTIHCSGPELLRLHSGLPLLLVRGPTDGPLSSGVRALDPSDANMYNVPVHVQEVRRHVDGYDLHERSSHSSRPL